MASRGNRHCDNCIRTLSFPINLSSPRSSISEYWLSCDSVSCPFWWQSVSKKVLHAMMLDYGTENSQHFQFCFKHRTNWNNWYCRAICQTRLRCVIWYLSLLFSTSSRSTSGFMLSAVSAPLPFSISIILVSRRWISASYQRTQSQLELTITVHTDIGAPSSKLNC